MKKIFILIIILFFLTSTAEVLAENNVNLYFFYGEGCPHCANQKIFLNQMESKYSNLNIKMYEVYSNSENKRLFEDFSANAGTKIQGVPTTFIDGKAHIGFNQNIEVNIENEIKRCSIEVCNEIISDSEYLNIKESKPDSKNNEYLLGYIIIGIIMMIILFFIIKKSFFKKEILRKKK